MTHVYFPTTLGARYLDICEWHSLFNYLALPRFPIQCWEVKTGGATYYNMRQYLKDIEIMRTYGFRIHYLPLG